MPRDLKTQKQNFQAEKFIQATALIYFLLSLENYNSSSNGFTGRFIEDCFKKNSIQKNYIIQYLHWFSK